MQPIYPSAQGRKRCFDCQIFRKLSFEKLWRFSKIRIWKYSTFSALSGWINRLHEQINNSCIFHENSCFSKGLFRNSLDFDGFWWHQPWFGLLQLWPWKTASTSCNQKSFGKKGSTKTFRTTMLPNIRIVSACRSLSKVAVGWRKPDGLRELSFISKLSLKFGCGL